jgi:small subunit ribosomal protein S16
MLRIRLRRVGKKKQPMYRIVVADSRAPRDGAFVESLGYYHPLNNPSTIVLDEERAKHWLDHGAQPSDRVAKLLKIQGLAEIPAKLATRMALGEQRAQEAQLEKAKAAKTAAAEAPTAEAPVAEAPAAEAPAAAPPEPVPEATAEAPADEPAATAPAGETEQAAE